MSATKRKEGYPLNQSPLFKLRTKKKLADTLGISTRTLLTFRNADSFYSERDIPKKNGGVRHIENPRRDLKLIQARLARMLGRITPPNYLFCPVKGRSYVSNAAQHAHSRVVRTLDIKQYFPNTTRNRVYRFFLETMRCTPDVASLLSDIGTYKGHLPTGSPLSPIMAFYAHFDVWEGVAALVRNYGAILTLYIDDLTISGSRVSDEFMWQVKKVIHGAGLSYHKEKVFRDRPAEITGVVITSGSTSAPNRQHRKRHQAKQALKHAITEIERDRLSRRIKGLSDQIAQITAAAV